MADDPENLVLEMLRAMRGDMIGLVDKVDRIVTEQRAHSHTLGVLLQEGRLLRAAVNDIAKENVTPGEISRA